MISFGFGLTDNNNREYNKHKELIIMKVIKDKKIAREFDEKIYKIVNPIYITSERFWDGGISLEASLQEKAEFYELAAKMSGVVKELLYLLNENVYIGKTYCEHYKLYAEWKDLRKFELFREIYKRIKNRYTYQLTLPEDEGLLDMIVEANFKYYSYITLFLPKSNIIIQPTCHSEVIIYAFDVKKIAEKLEKMSQQYPGIIIKI